ncbi:hypothetical protein N7489_011140 [Penicillium chrysogenum]|uniref:uncharacterized protein n=1 Tax=Penicillium chrysogenum TaxID=5076 RepID=UPI0024DF1038|nr:uncharacterized protein N7489_011140 [Penicillium chrysogenum]KAJ5230432.1 hypothetical protein N7489_011140 [Penicillium chrysogenum]
MPRRVVSCAQHGGHRDRPDKLELYLQICKPNNTVVHWMIAMKYPDADRCTRLHSTGYMGNRTLLIEPDKRFDSDAVETTHYLGRFRASESTTVETEAEKVPLQSCQLWACYLILRLERKGLLQEGVRRIMDRGTMIHALFMGMQVMGMQVMGMQVMGMQVMGMPWACTQIMITQIMATQTMTTQTMTTQATDIQAIGTDVIDTQIMATQTMATQTMTTQTMTTQTMTTQATGIQVIGTDVIDTQVMATQIMIMQIMITQTMATHAMGWAYRRITATQVMDTQVMGADTDIRYQYHSFRRQIWHIDFFFFSSGYGLFMQDLYLNQDTVEIMLS